eukprot:211432-Prymnesium_polylepis.1
MRATVGPRTPCDAHTPQATFLAFCRSAFSAAATVKEELAKAAEGGPGGGEAPPWRRWRLRSWRRRRGDGD